MGWQLDTGTSGGSGLKANHQTESTPSQQHTMTQRRPINSSSGIAAAVEPW